MNNFKKNSEKSRIEKSFVRYIKKNNDGKTITIVTEKGKAYKRVCYYYPTFHQYYKFIYNDGIYKVSFNNLGYGVNVELLSSNRSDDKPVHEIIMKEHSENPFNVQVNTNTENNIPAVINDDNEQVDEMENIDTSNDTVEEEFSEKEIDKEELEKIFNEIIKKEEIVEVEKEEKEIDDWDLEKPVKHEKFEMIKMCISNNIPVYLAGPAGSGKNYTLEQIAAELDMSFYFSNSVQQEYKLTGFIDAGGKYHETEFYKAAMDDKECVFFLDEMDASIPEVLVLLNAAIANGYFEFPTGKVNLNHIHFVAAGNTVGSGADDKYTGRMVIDQATLDRFAIIEFDYDKNIELHLASGNKELVEFIHDLREISDRAGIRATFSYRCISMVCKLQKAGMALEQILLIAVVKGLDKDTINTLRFNKEGTYYAALRNIQQVA